MFEDLVLVRNDDATKKLFYDATRLLKKQNALLAHLMDTTGDSYLAGLYLMKIRDSDSTENAVFIPKKAKSQDNEKLAAYYRFTATQLDLEASTFKEAIRNQNYAKDKCFVNSMYDFTTTTC